MIKYYKEDKWWREEIARSPEQQRFRYFSKKVPKTIAESGLYEDDTKIAYFDNVYNVMFNNKLFRRFNQRSGFTYRKDTKKLWGWNNLHSRNTQITLKQVFNDLNKEWVVNEQLTPWLTKELARRIFAGKITNPTDACKYIISSLKFPKTTSPELLRKAITNGRVHKKELYAASKVLKDLNSYLADEDTTSKPNWFDICQQANTLGRKLDWNWSDKRFEEEHNKMTREIMALELSFVDDVKIEYEHLPSLPESFELIASKRRCFEEGALMKHCVYTNYWSRIEDKRYMAYHLDYEGEPITIGLEFRRDIKKAIDDIKKVIDDIKKAIDEGREPEYFARIDQMYTRGNRAVSQKAHDYIVSVFTDEVLKVLGKNYLKNATRPNRLPLEEEEELTLPF